MVLLSGRVFIEVLVLHTDPLESPIVAINVGLGMFAESLRVQGVQVAQVDRVPPAGGDQQLADVLDELL